MAEATEAAVDARGEGVGDDEVILGPVAIFDGERYHDPRISALEAERDRLREALALTRPALVTWDDYDRGTLFCCCCDRGIGALPPTDCQHGNACPLVVVQEISGGAG